MPSKIDPGDWDRLFAPHAPRRGGPLRALVTLLITALVIALFGAGITYAVRYRDQQTAYAIATATAYAPTAAANRTATAQALAGATATIVARRTATALARQPTPTPQALTAAVFNGGNVRERPVNGRPLDQINAGESVQLLEKTPDGGWYRITTPRGVTGWVSQTLLTLDPEVARQVPQATPAP